MIFAILDLLLVVALFGAMLGAQVWGQRLGERQRRLALKSESSEKDSQGATETAVFALLGLFLAFTFQGVGSRFDQRRELIVSEANAIGTAWLRIDILPPQRQPELRQLFRQYVDARLDAYRLLNRGERPGPALMRVSSLQNQIWSATTRAVAESGEVPPATLVLPAMNEMFDIASTRVAAALTHSPWVVYLMIAVLSLVSSLYVGYGMAGREMRSFIHSIGFAASMCVVLYVIVALEFPRLSFVRLDVADRALFEVRASMK